MRVFAVPLALLMVVVLSAGVVSAADPNKPRHGSSGIGDPYYPKDGNGGYDVRHYGLDLRFDPATDRLKGKATIKARSTHALSRFNLDFDGLTVRSVRVNDRAAKWKRKDGELIITPARSIGKGKTFTTVVTYDGIPAPDPSDPFGGGWTHTDDGAFVAGQPHGATTWFPANDHPADKASLTVRINVPSGTEAVSNGVLKSKTTKYGRTTWTWNAVEPMAPYLAVLMIGEFAIDAYQADGVRYWDALDPNLFDPVASPTTGTQFAIARQANNAYKRLSRTIAVPAGGADMSFTASYDTEFPWDFLFVEARTPGMDDWTTLPDANGATSNDPWTCPYLLNVHPFLIHYQTPVPDAPCLPTGTTGEWWAATGGSNGPQSWSIDLSAWAGASVEVAITYATDDVVQNYGVFIDDIVVSTGEGSTSFEDDGDVMDGWTVTGPPADSPGNDNDWIVGTVVDVPPPHGPAVETAFARQPEIVSTLSDWFGPYPFTTSGGIVDDIEGVGFALETQTRPIYAREFFGDPFGAESVIVHELAHQWYGDSLALKRWQHIWLNEGFATYAEWLWGEDQGYGTAQDNFDFWATVVPPDDPFWAVPIGDPGPEALFDFAVYVRGAMTLHALRTAVGDATFFAIMETWASKYEGRNVTTKQFIALAEKRSGQQLDDLFATWLSGGYPLPVATLAPMDARIRGGLSADDLRGAPAVARGQLERYGRDTGLLPGD